MDQVKEHYTQLREEALKKNCEVPEEYVPGNDDGTFLMCYKDWRNIFGNLYICKDYSITCNGYYITSQFTTQTTSGILTNSEESRKNFALNDQYIMKVKKETGAKCFIQLTQRDGRLFRGEKFPYDKIL